MSAIALVAGSLMASIQLSVFPVFVLLVPGFVAAYYQRKKNVRFEKLQRKRVSAWYVGISDQTQALEKARGVEQVLQTEADKQRQAIEEKSDQ